MRMDGWVGGKGEHTWKFDGEADLSKGGVVSVKKGANCLGLQRRWRGRFCKGGHV